MQQIILVVSLLVVLTTAATDFDLVKSRAMDEMIAGYSSGDVSKTNSYLGVLTSSGSFSDVSYLAGCNISRDSYPGAQHASRIATMARAWRAPASSLYKNTNLESKIFLAMSYWFKNDYTNEQCARHPGVTGYCPCGTPGNWHLNWWHNEIGVPTDFGKACFAMSTSSQFISKAYQGCVHILNRGNFVGMTGANALWQAQVIIFKAYISNDSVLLNQTFARAAAELVYTPKQDDGIKSDGQFFQHSGIVYGGGYGSAFVDTVVELFLASRGTSFAMNPTRQAVFSTMVLDGTRWNVIYPTATVTSTAWDLNVKGRELARGAYTLTNNALKRTKLLNLTAGWARQAEWIDYTNMLAATTPPPVGNRMFHSADLMVHRGAGYFVSVRSWSNRTVNSECVNNENIKGLHLADGATYVYHNPNDYMNGPIGWEWDHIPGTSVNPGANTLSCSTTKITKRPTKFVGGYSDKKRGVFAMDFTGALNSTLSLRKSWYFFDNEFVVLISNIRTNVTTQAVHHTLDSRIAKGSTTLLKPNATSVTTVTTGSGTAYPWWLHHDSIGYVIPANKIANKKRLTYKIANVTSSWSATALATSKTPITVPMWSAYLESKLPPVTSDSLEYIVSPNIAQRTFASTRANQLLSVVRVVTNTATVHAVYQSEHRLLGLVFWTANANFVDTKLDWNIVASAPCVVQLQSYAGSQTVTIGLSDPTQLLSEVTLTIKKTITCSSCTTVSTGVTAVAFSLVAGSRNCASLNVTLPAIPPAARAETDSGSKSNHQLSTGAVVAIVVASVLVAAALLALIVFIVIRRNRNGEHRAALSEALVPTD